jgi:hypothetical protein
MHRVRVMVERTNLSELQKRIKIARYDIDPVAVADAMVRRRWSLAVAAYGRPSVTCVARGTTKIRPLAA